MAFPMTYEVKEIFKMYQFPIGVVVESFRKEIHEAIKEASALGLQGIQM